MQFKHLKPSERIHLILGIGLYMMACIVFLTQRYAPSSDDTQAKQLQTFFSYSSGPTGGKGAVTLERGQSHIGSGAQMSGTQYGNNSGSPVRSVAPIAPVSSVGGKAGEVTVGGKKYTGGSPVVITGGVHTGGQDFSNGQFATNVATQGSPVISAPPASAGSGASGLGGMASGLGSMANGLSGISSGASALPGGMPGLPGGLPGMPDMAGMLPDIGNPLAGLMGDPPSPCEDAAPMPKASGPKMLTKINKKKCESLKPPKQVALLQRIPANSIEINNIGSSLTGSLSKAGGLVGNIMPKVSSLMPSMPAIPDVGGMMGGITGGLGGDVMGKISGMIPDPASMLNSALPEISLGGMMSNPMGALQGVVGDAMGAAGIGDITGALGDPMGALTGTLPGGGDIGAMASGAMGGLSSAASGAMGGLSSAASGAMGAASGVISNPMGAMKGAASGAISSATAPVTSAVSKASGMVSSAGKSLFGR